MSRSMRVLGAVLVMLLVATAALPAAAMPLEHRQAPAPAVDGFDAAEFGRPIEPEEQEQLTGEWWKVAFGAAMGAADAAYTYARSRPFEPRSTRYWLGMAASVLVGAGMGALGSATEIGLEGARAAAKAAMAVYSRVRSHVVNEGFSAALKANGY